MYKIDQVIMKLSQSYLPRTDVSVLVSECLNVSIGSMEQFQDNYDKLQPLGRIRSYDDR